jgi:isocitrate/isopropylmalate dehydrogenase
MASNRKVMVLPGDGIGNEVMAANMKLIDIAAWALTYQKGLLAGRRMMCMACR